MPDDYCDDVTLVTALRAGSEEAFEWLLDRYDASLHRVARTFVRSGAAVDEVVQDTWLGVIEGIDRFEFRSSLKTWIFHIMMNKAKSRGVRDKRNVPFSAMSDGIGPTIEPDRFLPADHGEFPGHWASPPIAWESLPEARLDALETLDQVRLAMSELPDAQRQVIALRDVEGLSSAEVCDVLGLTAANERVILHRARGRVRASLERYFDSRNGTARIAALVVATTVAMAVSHNAAVVITAQVLLAVLLVATTIVLTGQLHDAIPSNIRTGVASGVGTVTWMVFVPFALAFGYVSNRVGVFTAGWMLVGVAAASAVVMVRFACERRTIPAERRPAHFVETACV